MAVPVLFLLIGGGTVLARLGGTTNPSSSSSIDLQKGLVGQWKFDGDAKDSTPYGNNGTVYSTTLTTDRKGKANSAYSFNGTSSTVGTPAMTTPGAGTTNQMTICAWVKGTVNQSIVRQQGGGNYIVLGWNGQDILSWDGGTNGLASGVAADNQWHQSCMTWQPNATNGFKSFADGALVTQRNSANTIIPNMSVPFFIGSYLDLSEWENGSIDDVCMYSRALSAAEITALYMQYDPVVKAAAGENGLVGWWKMDGNAKDATPYANNGIVTGATLTTDREGKANSAYSFNGTSANITTSYVQQNITKYTVSAWVNTTDTGSMKALVQDRGSGAGMSLTLGIGTTGGLHGGPGQIGWEVDSNGTDIGVSSVATVNDGKWHHIVGVFSGGGAVTVSQFSIFIDGVAAATTSGTAGSATAPLSGLGGTVIGYHQAWNTYFNGSIDDVRIYNRALGASEIATQYNSYNSQLSIGGSGAPGSVSLGKGLVGDWAMNGNAKDNTPYGNNGTVNGAALTTDRKGRANSAYSFNGSTNFIGMPTVSIPSDISVSAWVYSTNYNQLGFVVSKNPVNSQWELFFESGVLRWRGSVVDNLASCTDPTNSAWHHLVATQTGTTVQIFIDGSRCFNGAVGGAIGNGSGVVEVGRFNGGYYFGGSIDDVRVWNRVLSQAEVTALYGVYR